MSSPRVQGTPNRHKPRFIPDGADRVILTAEGRAILCAAILLAIKDRPLGLPSLCKIVGQTSKVVLRSLRELRAKGLVTRHGYAKRTQYGLPGSTPRLDPNKWVDDAISRKPKAAPASESWWVGKDRETFTALRNKRDKEAGWSNGSKGIETRVVE